MFVPLVALDFAVLVGLAGVPGRDHAACLVLGTVADHRHGVAVTTAIQLGYFPNGPHGHPCLGPLRRHAAEGAAVTAVACLILFLLFNYVLVATARPTPPSPAALLGPAEDPLREAKEVLDRPGPLARRG